MYIQPHSSSLSEDVSVFSSVRVLSTQPHIYYQATLRRDVVFDGVGVHSGLPVTMTVCPAAPHTGYVFVRSDVTDKNPRIHATYDHVVNTMMCTQIANADGVSVSTIEHVVAALCGAGISNAEIIVSGPEVPIMDGSSCIYTRAFLDAGRSVQSSRQRVLKVMSPVRVDSDSGFAEFLPALTRSIDVSIDFYGRLNAIACGSNFSFNMDHDDFHTLVSDARTFGFYEDAIKLQQSGLARGASLDNVVVFHEGAVMNEGGLRSDNEPIRHKVLDAVGDLALSNCIILGKFNSHNTGHGLNNQLLRALFNNPAAYVWVD